MANNFFIRDKISYHFKSNSGLYFISIVTLLIGLVVGLYLALTGYTYTSLLTSADKTMFDYITGTASYTDIFYTRLLDVLLCLLIIFILNLSVYTSFISFIFIGYQMVLFVLTCGAIISLYGLSGVLNVIFFVLPINLANLLIFNVANNLAVRRAKDQRCYRLKFLESFKEDGFISSYLICVVMALIVCVINSFILPFFIKSFVVINY